MVREYILTDVEREAITRFLKDGKGSNPIRVLRYRAKKFLPVIEKEVDLLKKLLETR